MPLGVCFYCFPGNTILPVLVLAMKMQIIDVDYVLVNERPVVRLFGKTARGRSACAFYEGYRPYFYADGEEAVELLREEPQVVNIEKLKRKRVMGYQQEKDIYKVTLKNPARTPELRDMLTEKGITTYESDVLFKYRFMNDMGIKGMGWVEVEEESSVSTGTVHADRCIKAKSLKPIDSIDDAPLKTLAFDIECVSGTAGAMPEASRDPVVMISVVFSEPFRGQESILLATRPGPGVTAMASEAEMLERFSDIIKEYDPDILTGYNLNNFDIPYLLERMAEHRMRPKWGRCTQKQVNARKIMSRYRISIIGRVVFDSFDVIKKDYSLMRYSLNFVSERLLGEKKEDVKAAQIQKYWRGNPEKYAQLARYALKDSVLAMKLVQKLNLMDKYFALCKVSGTLMQDTLSSGESIRIENFLLRKFNSEGFVFPTRPTDQEIAKRNEDKKRELKGGFVIEPIKDLHSNVIVLDFKSMYPSIIRSFNICPTTLIDKEKVDNPLRTVDGTEFTPFETRQGIIPGILEGLMKSRAAAKKKKANAKDKYRRRAYDAEQWALKIMANAFYGYMGYSRARIYDLRIANAITSSGRNIIHVTREIVEKEYGYTVVYGDTDSVMVKIDTEDLDEVKKVSDRMASEITERLPGIMELEFEKFFKRFMPLTKKRYFAWKFEPTKDGWKEGIDTKGIETVRRDWCELVGDSVSDVINIVLKKDDPMEAVSYFTGIVKKLVKNEIPINKLVITKTMTKSPEKYAGVQPHIELVKKIQSRNTDEVPGIGDRISYVIVKGLGLLSKRAEDPGYVEEKGIQVDSKYYIENQLLPPIERIFTVLGVERSTLMGGGRQVNLMCAINGNNGQAGEKKEIGLSEVTGFTCRKCSRFYTRVPLIGVCECGGQLSFCHKGGVADSVRV